MSSKRIIAILDTISTKFLIAALLHVVYSYIAYEFNLPTFHYWIALGVTILIDYFHK